MELQLAFHGIAKVSANFPSYRFELPYFTCDRLSVLLETFNCLSKKGQHFVSLFRNLHMHVPEVAIHLVAHYQYSVEGVKSDEYPEANYL